MAMSPVLPTGRYNTSVVRETYSKLSHASQQNLSFDHLVYLGNHASTDATERPLISLYRESPARLPHPPITMAAIREE